MAEPLIRFEEVTFYYPQAEVPALEGITFNIEKAEFVGITGPAGAGKSTLACCFNGIIPHFQAGQSKGDVRIQGVSTRDIPMMKLACRVGSVFQDPDAQLIALTVEDEVAYGLENMNVPREVMLPRIEKALNTVGIANLREREIRTLSGGQKQKVAIAAVLAMEAEILVLDEPTSELDPLGTEAIFGILTELNRQGITVVIIEQKIDMLAKHLQRLIVLDRGKMVADGKPKQVLANKEVQRIGIKMPEVSEFALLCDPELKEVPLTLEEGRQFLKERFYC